MEKSNGEVGFRDASSSGFGFISLWVPSLSFLLSVPVIEYHIYVWQRAKVKRQELLWKLSQKNEGWYTWNRSPPPPQKASNQKSYWPSMSHVPIFEPVTCKEED